MLRFVLIALAAVTTPMAASAQNQPDAGIPGSINAATQATVVHSYAMLPHTVSPKEELALLNRLCASSRRIDQQRCEGAWRRINAEYARMQAKRSTGE